MQLLERVIRGHNRGFVVAVDNNVVLRSEVSAGPLRAPLPALGNAGWGTAGRTLRDARGLPRSETSLLWRYRIGNAVYASAISNSAVPPQTKYC